MAGIVVPLVLTLVGVFATTRDSGDNSATDKVASTTPAGGNAPVANGPSPSPQTSHAPSASASPSNSAGRTPTAANTAPSSSPPAAVPPGYVLEELRWDAAPPRACEGEHLVIDLDTGMGSVVDSDGVTVLRGQPLPGHEAAEIAYEGKSATGCHSLVLRNTPKHQAGVLPASAPRTFEQCRAAGVTGIEAPSNDGRLQRGSAICSVTDEGNVAMAIIDEWDLLDSFTSRWSGRLWVWVKQ